MRLSKLGYDNSNDTDCAYMYILSVFHGYPIDECNTVLEKLNVKLLVAFTGALAVALLSGNLLREKRLRRKCI